MISKEYRRTQNAKVKITYLKSPDCKSRFYRDFIAIYSIMLYNNIKLWHILQRKKMNWVQVLTYFKT